MAWDRTERTEALLREKIAIIVLEKLNDPRLGFVTITGAKLTKDKRQCKVLFTVLGTPVQRRLSEQALRDAAPHIQQVLAPTMRLRTLPELRFVYDEGVERGARMLGLLDELAKENADAPPKPEGAEGAGAAQDADAPPEPPREPPAG